MFIVEQKTEGWAPYTCSPPGSVILGCLMGSDGMMLRASIMFTGCSSGTLRVEDEGGGGGGRKNNETVNDLLHNNGGFKHHCVNECASR